jgi:uncharacterized protein
VERIIVASSPGMRARRHVSQAPSEVGEHAGLAFSRFAPATQPWGSVLIVHGADSAKESHFEFARAARACGLEAIAFDLRGHGDSKGALDEHVIEDLAAIASLMSVRPLALRGSSMGGYLALVGARAVGATAVIAICPAPGELLLSGLRGGQFAFAHTPGLEAFVAAHDLNAASEQLDLALLLMHAEGDELIPATNSAELHRRASSPHKRLLILPGGHHRSIQHDPELHGESLKFLKGAWRPRGDVRA